MKKLLLLLSLAFMTFGMKAQSIGSYTIVEHDGYYLQYTVTSVSPAECVVSCSEYYSESYIDVVSIPSTIMIEGTEFSVTSVATKAFEYCYSIKKIELPNSIRSIGDNAFYYCSSMSEIVLSENLTHIGASAFYGCSFTDIILPDGITAINNGIFSKCTKLTNIEIPNSVTTIGNTAFYYCTELREITLPENITEIKDYAFSGCSKLSLVKCYAATPPTCNSIFMGTPEDMIIRVPQAYLDLYKANESWNKYDIRAIETESIDEMAEATTLYPNPAIDRLYIESYDNIIEASIYSISGALLYKTTPNGNSIDVSNLNKGAYFVRIKTDKEETTLRFMKN